MKLKLRGLEMDGFIVDEDGKLSRKRENGESWACSHVHRAHHRRSKSSTDKNFDAATFGVLHAMENSPNVSLDSRCKGRIQRPQSPLHPYPSGTMTKSLSNHRASLEKDIELLQLRLQQEKTMRAVLERAMGRASSTLSPGHRHFASQTKDLISEIELLEEEVANRENYVLSLYRNTFDNCVSGAPSEQSSGMISPTRPKNVKKHPSIIASAFCSSTKKFSLLPFQVLTSIKDSKKKNAPQSKTKHASSLGGQTNIRIESRGSDHIKVQTKMPNVEKTSLARTLKDHLYQCPSKLSEELVRCMAAIYCWLQTAPSTNPEKNRSPLLSRSYTNVILPRRGIGEVNECSCSSTVEISWLPVDRSQFSRASYAINNYRLLVEQLERVNACQMGSDAQTAFWINVYNSLVMHAYLAYGVPHGPLRRMALFHRAAYNIGGHVISANAIEHSVFCVRTPRIGRWFETMISTTLRKRTGDDKQLLGSKFALQNPQPLICFALCTGVSSDPVLKVYTATNIKEELEVATKEFLQANVVVKKSRKVILPKLLERFAKEANIGSSDDLLKWVIENVDKKLQDSIRNCTDNKAKRKTSLIIEWLPYNSRFRYILTKDLVEKSWRV